MNKQYIKFIFAILIMNLLFQVTSLAQSQKTVVVKDESGNPIPGVSVTIGESAKPVMTNNKGEFLIQADTKTPVLLEAEGYESQLVTSTPPVGLADLVLIKSPFMMGAKDNIIMPFGTFKKRLIPAAITTLDVEEILNYDQQGSYTGALYGRIPGLFGSSSFRGFGSSPLVIVDGIPRPAGDFNLQQISKITVVKDLYSSLMYGVQGTNGIIYITTKRGEPLKKSMRFTVTAGASNPISYPKYLGAADYMKLYNEALSNDGLPAKYGKNLINYTATGAFPYRYPDQEYYNSTYLKNWSSYFNVVGEVSGGNDVAQYYLNLGWNRNTGILKLGQGGDERTDRLNMRGNIDYKLNDFIKLRFDGTAIFNINYTPRYTSAASGASINPATGTVQYSSAGTDFWTLSSTWLPDIYPVLYPARLLNDPALIGSAKPINGDMTNGNLPGGTSQYLTNMYGELTLNGPRQINSRLMNINTGLDFDLSSITSGLKASAFLSFDMFSWFMVDIMNSYAVYKANWVNDTISSWNKYNTDVKVDQQTLTDATFYRRTGAFGTINYNRAFGNHEITIDGLAYRDLYSAESVNQATKHLHFGLRANYTYLNKFIAEVTGVLVCSSKLFATTPRAFSPGIGIGWVMSEENFLKNNSLINYLKIRSNWAISNTDENFSQYYAGNDIFTSSSSYGYNQGTNSNSGYIIVNGNPNIGFEKRMNFNLGFESTLLDYKLGVEASYFYYKSYDMIIQRINSLPVYFTGIPYGNFGSNNMQGAEVGLNYRANISDLKLKIGSNLTYALPKALTVDELNYNEAYRRQTGKPTDAMFGWVALGLFQTQAEIDASPFQTFGTVKPGDIKYADLNGDGVINDLDQKMIGNSNPRVEYSFNLDLKYKGFELFALGVGQDGQDVYFNNAYYWVYSTRKYSEVVFNRWTETDGTTATYPRLTTLSNSNDFRNSTFWLYKYNWFKLQTAQLTYTLPVKIGGTAETRFFIRGSNLGMISNIKKKAQLNIGTAPQMRSFSLGLQLVL